MLKLEQLAELLEKNRAAASARVKEFSIGGKPFAFNSQPAIMGVVNLSPDSWYRESVCLTAEAAVQRGKVLTAQGADIVDIGAESTLAHAARVDDAAQNSKLIPVIKELRTAGILVSVETYSPAVTRACLEAGANILNLTGTDGSDELFRLVAAHDAAVILCYVQGKNVREVGDFDFGADPVEMMRGYFARQIEIAQRHGVEKNHPRSRPRLLLPQFAGQRGARAASDEHFPEHVPAADARFPDLPRAAACLRVFPRRGALRRAVLCRAGRAGQDRFVPHPRSPAHQGRAGYDEGFLTEKEGRYCGGKRSATPLLAGGENGVAAALCHRTPNQCRRGRLLAPTRKTPSSSDLVIHCSRTSKP
jgi:hypothetical protein